MALGVHDREVHLGDADAPKEVRKLPALRMVRLRAEDLEEEAAVVGEALQAQDPHSLDRSGLRVVLGLRPELGSDVVWRHAIPPAGILAWMGPLKRREVDGAPASCSAKGRSMSSPPSWHPAGCCPFRSRRSSSRFDWHVRRRTVRRSRRRTAGRNGLAVVFAVKGIRPGALGCGHADESGFGEEDRDETHASSSRTVPGVLGSAPAALVGRRRRARYGPYFPVGASFSSVRRNAEAGADPITLPARMSLPLKEAVTKAALNPTNGGRHGPDSAGLVILPAMLLAHFPLLAQTGPDPRENSFQFFVDGVLTSGVIGYQISFNHNTGSAHRFSAPRHGVLARPAAIRDHLRHPEGSQQAAGLVEQPPRTRGRRSVRRFRSSRATLRKTCWPAGSWPTCSRRPSRRPGPEPSMRSTRRSSSASTRSPWSRRSPN